MITTENTRRALQLLISTTAELTDAKPFSEDLEAAITAARAELDVIDQAADLARSPFVPEAEAVGEIRHLYATQPTKVGMKLTQSTLGVSLEADVDFHRGAGMTDDQAVEEAARLVALAYQRGEGKARDLGLTLGRAAKNEGGR